MSKIEFSKVTNANTLSVINDNFTKLANELQEKVYYRNNPNGEPNSLETPLDFNGNIAYNIGTIASLPVSDGPGEGPIVFVTEYGVPMTQSTVNAAVNDLKDSGGGMLYFPNGTAEGIVVPDLGNTVSLEINGPDIAASYFGEPAGTAGYSQKVFRGQNDRLSSNRLHSLVHIENHPKGSGQSGQTTADVGLTVAVLKQGLASGSAVSGELNGIDIGIRNDGADSDSAALLLNVGTYGTGFNCLFEGQVSDLRNNVVNKALNVQLCVVDTRANTSYGMVIQSQKGAQDVGILIQNNDGGDPFSDFLQFVYNDKVPFRVNGLGHIYMGGVTTGDNLLQMRLNVTNGVLNFQNNGNAASVMNLTQDGKLAISSNFTYGNITLVNAVTTTASVGGVAKPATYAGFMTMQLSGNTYKIPYYNA